MYMSFIHTKWMFYLYRSAFSGLKLCSSHDWRVMASKQASQTPFYPPFCAYLWNYTQHVTMVQCLKTWLSSPGDSEWFSSYSVLKEEVFKLFHHQQQCIKKGECCCFATSLGEPGLKLLHMWTACVLLIYSFLHLQLHNGGKARYKNMSVGSFPKGQGKLIIRYTHSLNKCINTSTKQKQQGSTAFHAWTQRVAALCFFRDLT